MVGWAVSCTRCDCKPTSTFKPTEAEAIAAWNTRPDTLPVTDEGYVEAVARALCISHGQDPDARIEHVGAVDNNTRNWEAFKRHARAALSVPRPDHRNEVLLVATALEHIAAEADTVTAQRLMEQVRALRVVEPSGDRP